MIVVRFREGRDKELKEWYEGLPRGERSRIIRKILIDYHISVTKNDINSKLDDIELKRDNSDKTSNIDISKKIDSLINIF